MSVDVATGGRAVSLLVLGAGELVSGPERGREYIRNGLAGAAHRYGLDGEALEAAVAAAVAAPDRAVTLEVGARTAA